MLWRHFTARYVVIQLQCVEYSLEFRLELNYTPGNPFTHLTSKMSILTDWNDRCILWSISSRILTYFGLILCLWNHAMCLRCFALTCKLFWKFYYNSSCLHRVGVVKSLVSICTVVQANHCRYAAWFHYIKSNQNMSRSTRNALQYMSITWIIQNGHFPDKYDKMGVLFSQCGRMGYPMWTISPLKWIHGQICECSWFPTLNQHISYGQNGRLFADDIFRCILLMKSFVFI